eukprot:COSAG04_NODE_35_length_34355_cov_13.301728_3_plen_236_part_00
MRHGSGQSCKTRRTGTACSSPSGSAPAAPPADGAAAPAGGSPSARLANGAQTSAREKDARSASCQRRVSGIGLRTHEVELHGVFHREPAQQRQGGSAQRSSNQPANPDPKLERWCGTNPRSSCSTRWKKMSSPGSALSGERSLRCSPPPAAAPACSASVVLATFCSRSASAASRSLFTSSSRSVSRNRNTASSTTVALASSPSPKGQPYNAQANERSGTVSAGAASMESERVPSR